MNKVRKLKFNIDYNKAGEMVVLPGVHHTSDLHLKNIFIIMNQTIKSESVAMIFNEQERSITFRPWNDDDVEVG